jgi:low temperature requirement protein LtrA
MEPAPPREIEPETEGDVRETEHPVTPLELFFDLVFVFAITQVTGLMSDDPTWAGVGKGLLILAALWWAWGAYAWLTNEIDPDEGSARLAVFVAMAAMFVAALAVPHAFDTDAVLFGLAYFVVRVMHIVLFAEATPHVDVRQATFRLARTAVPGPALLVVAGFLDGGAQIALWLVALTIDYSGPYVFGVRGFSISAGHFAERYGLIVIIALGESIVAIGIGAAGIELDPPVVLAALLGIVLAAALWWAYFDIVAHLARKRLMEAHGHERARLARDSYSYLHLPMFAGIVFFALGAKKVLAHVDEPLATVPAVALCGGVGLYLISHDAIRFRSVRSVNPRRCLAAAACAALIPPATRVDGLFALALVAAVCTALVAYETLCFRDGRTRMRTAV